MPELPEVETIRRQLAPLVTGAELVDGGSHWSAKFTPALEALGHEVGGTRRRGKYLILDLVDLVDAADAPRELIIHLGMTGRLAVEPDPDLDHPHLRAWWRLDDGRTLTFHDARRFGRVHVVARGDHTAIPTLAALGPEPFDEAFNGRDLAAFVKRSNRHLKTLLLGQRAVAGVGNIYADEALWTAGINPATRRLSRARADRLVEAVRAALQSGLDHGGTTLRDYVDSAGAQGSNQHTLHCYGRSGEPCERCGTVLRKRELDARTTTWCPQCQSK
ncbi:MAG: bifunctional DNA-formamidopyrimidine glycosylase/DNA-(apurinic or apyrimidinic site) lyase [Acidimicrobiales bacterium]